MIHPGNNSLSASRTATLGASGAITWSKDGADAYNAANPLEPPVAAGGPRDCTGCILYIVISGRTGTATFEWSAEDGMTGNPPRGLEWISQEGGVWSWKPEEEKATNVAYSFFYQVWLLEPGGDRQEQTELSRLDVGISAAPVWP